jgi:NUMOD3 motif
MIDQTYIYALYDPRDWSIRYIGKANNPWKRLAQHRYKKLFQTFQITILSVCRISEWEYWEKFWIATARASGADLWNATEGGNGRTIQIPFSLKHRTNLSRSASLRKHSPETRAKLSKARRRRKISEATRTKTSLSLKGRTLSESHKAKIGAANKGRRLGPQPLNVRAKKSLSQTLRWQKIRETSKNRISGDVE